MSGDEPDAALLDFGMVSVWLLDAEKVPYPYYNRQGAVPVDSERLTIRQGTEPVSTEAIYREKYGNAHLSKAALDFSANGSGNVRMEVAAPSWAAAYAIEGSGGDFIYQADWGLGISSDKHPIPSHPVRRIPDRIRRAAFQESEGRSRLCLSAGRHYRPLRRVCARHQLV